MASYRGRIAESLEGRKRAIQFCGDTLSVQCTDQTAGAGDGNRTRDLLITNQLLYQLSYAGARVQLL